jgi:para-nitrobenzyl esterase
MLIKTGFFKLYFLSLFCIFIYSSGIAEQKANLIDVKSVEIQSGIISGKTTDDKKIKIFMGIPYAAPPIGQLRWKAPQPINSWKGIRKCVIAPPSAMQSKPVPFFCWSKEFLIPEEPISEDCLYLNIWTPANSTKEYLPVMVWIHGGGFTSGSGTVPLYDGEEMARKGIIFVTINYRLGIFGFLAHPELSAESELKVSGNYGILDQIAALKWIRENIIAFGGDSENVTIAGQSAGAFSVNALMVSPVAKGLFQKAIAESGGMFGNESILGRSLQKAETEGKQLTDKLGIVSINQLRSISADSLLKIPGHYSLVIDSTIIPPINETFIAGKQNDVPLISGWNADDGISFGQQLNAIQFRNKAKEIYGERADKFLKLFPANTDEEAYKSQKLLSQLNFGWNNYSWARLQSKTGKGKAYLYYFKHIPPGNPDYGAFHSAEFPYALHTLKYWNRPFTSIDYQLEETMSSYWINFVKTSNPNGQNLTYWPPFNDINPEVLEINDSVKVAPLPYQEQLIFLNEINK